MTLAKQGILIGHAITLTMILLFVVAWKTPSKTPLRLEGKTSLHPFYNSGLLRDIILKTQG